MKISEITTESNDSYVMAVEEGDELLDESLPALPYRLILTDCKAWYEGVITRNDIERSIANLKMDSCTYYQYTREAFFDQNGSGKCIFHVENLDPVKKVKFVWKTLLETGIKYQLGSVTLRLRNSEEVLKRLLLIVMTQLDKNCLRINLLEKERDRLASDRDEALSALTTCVEAKHTMEKEMFGKFLAVLNEKKVFVQSIENENSTQVTKASRPAKSVSPIPVASTSGTKKKLFIDEDDEDDSLLFDDLHDDDPQPVRRNLKTAKASQKRKVEVAASNNGALKPKPTVKASVPPKMTRRSTGSDSDPSKLLDIL